MAQCGRVGGGPSSRDPLASRLLQAAGEVPQMTITLPGLIVLIIIAAICGALGRAIAGEVRGFDPSALQMGLKHSF